LTDLNQFIAKYLPSVDHLRVLLHLRATAPAPCDPLEVAARLYLLPPVALEVLTCLRNDGLAIAEEDPPRYRFHPSTEEQAALVEDLAEMDRTHPVTLINMIYANRSPLRAFADAFKLTKDKGT